MLFDMVQRVRLKTDVPLLFMTYLNPVYTYGKENFLSRCAECGIDGIIVPDMPFEEKDELDTLCMNYKIDLISMLAPTSEERIALIAKEATGFIYCVSSLGVTGVRSNISAEIGHTIDKVRKITDIPCAIGFGISTPQQAKSLAELSDGIIVGSAIVKLIAKYGRDCVEPVIEYVESMKNAIEHFK